jgi:PAS domain S-box-containing protein
LERTEWMRPPGASADTVGPTVLEWPIPSYGNLAALNTSRLILDSVGTALLSDIAGSFLGLLDTSAAVYEKNGDCAFAACSSAWCQFMDLISRRNCGSPDNRNALASGHWHCHESSWNDAALRSMETGEPADVECRGGIRLFAAPIRAGDEIVGSVSMGYGDPPRGPAKRRELAAAYRVRVKELRELARACQTLPPYLIELAKERLLSSARLIGEIVERKQREEALCRSEGRFKALVEITSEWLWEVDRNGIYTYSSPKVRDLLGYEPAEVLGRTPLDFVRPPERERVARVLQEALRSAAPLVDFESTYLHKSGETVVLETSGVPILDSDGRLRGYRGVDRDITRRKRTEEALERRIVALTRPLESGEDIAFEDLFNLKDIQHLQDLFAEVWGVAALITRPDGTPITQPSNFTYLCGEFIRKNPQGFARCQVSDAALGRHNPDGPVIQACLSAGLCGAGASITVGGRHIGNWLIGQVRNEAQTEERMVEYARQIGADEAAFREAFLQVPIMPQEQFERIANALFVLANQLSAVAYQNIQQARFIADRKRAEEELRHSEARFRLVVESSPLAIRVARQDAGIEYVNPAFIEKFGYTIEDIPTLEDWHRLAYPDPAYRQRAIERWQESLGRAANATGAARGLDVSVTCKDGSVREMEVFGTPMGDKTLAFFLDITERKRMAEERRKMESQMRQVQRLESLGVLAGGIAHDFNNLLTAILGNADLALLTLSPVSPARQRVEEIAKASQHAADLCRQMLAYSGKGRFVLSRCDLSEIVRDMGQILEISVSKNAVMRYSLAEGLPAVEADATQIRQIIMNLITNASEALGEARGVITVVTGVMECDEAYLSESYLNDRLPGGRYVSLEVSDTGAGMDEETRGKLFDPFFTTKFTGRGLGLAAVLGIVRGHKGAFKVYSEVGKGTNFKILLPAVDWAPGERVKPEAESVPLAGGGTVLVVDDEPLVRGVASSMLEMLGFRVLTAANGREGLEIFRAKKDEIACVILDLTMPEMSGDEAFRDLRTQRSDVRVHLASGFNEQDVSQRFVGAGLAGFIQKPYTVAKLREILKSALG